jgi:hypothetical protein
LHFFVAPAFSGSEVRMLKKVFLFTVCMAILTVSSLAQSDIRRVDFKNFTFYPFCAGEEAEKVTVRNGEFSSEKKTDDFVDRFFFRIISVTYGDLNGDKKDEAIVLSVCNTGGTGNFSEGYVYSLKAGKPALLTRIGGGDRAIGGLRKATVGNGLLVIDQNDPDRNEASCCADYAVISRYRLHGTKLNPVGRPVSRALYRPQRVSFRPGTSKMRLDIEVEEIKRLLIGARAGQTLTISFASPNRENIYASLLEGEADVAAGENGFVARLKQSGDFLVQIQNTYKLPSKVTLTIEIK